MTKADQATHGARAGEPASPLSVTAQHVRANYTKVSGQIYARAMGPWRFASTFGPLGAAGLALLIGLMMGHGLAMGESGRLALACGFAVLAAQGASTLIQRLTRNRHLADEGAFLRPFIVEADADGLTARSETAATRIVWGGVLDIVVNQDFVLIFTDAANALAIPESAFPDALRMSAFGERLVSLWRAAQVQAKPA